MSEETPTVRDIAWRTNPGMVGYVYAEDQALFEAFEYAEQVCIEHNTVIAIHYQLKEAQARLEAAEAVVNATRSYVGCIALALSIGQTEYSLGKLLAALAQYEAAQKPPQEVK